MGGVNLAAELREARHAMVNGRIVQVEYGEYRARDGNVMARYSTRVDGHAFPLELKISKAILQTIQTRFDGAIYHIIPDSILEQVREMTKSTQQRIRESLLPVKYRPDPEQ